MSWVSLANKYIAPSAEEKTLVYRNGNVDDIITVILDADQKGRAFTAKFARHLRGSSDRETLHNVWDFIKTNITYVRDRTGNEVIKSPGATWKSKKGDCKSFSVLAGSLLGNLGYRYKYRVAFYDPSTPEQGHIYPVVVLKNGTEVIVDAVYDYFDREVPYWKAWDYDPRSHKRSKVSGVGESAASKPQFLGMSVRTWAILGGIAFLMWPKQKSK